MTNQTKIVIAMAAAIACVAAIAIFYKQEPMEVNEIGYGSDSPIDDNNDLPIVGNGSTAATGTKPSQRNFSLSEYDSHDGVKVPVELYDNVQNSMDNLQVLRDALGLPIFINSGYRSPAHNKAVGGVSNSCHLKGIATDIKVPGMSPSKVRAKIQELITAGEMSEGGIGSYATFTHYDVRGTRARWNG